MRILLYISICFLFLSCSNSEDKIDDNLIDNGAAISIIGNETINFGNIIQGEKVNLEFKIRNIGTGDLIITNAKASCGCTVPEWPKKLLVPGAEGEIKVAFNSEHRIGYQKKTITLTTNATPSIKILTIEGMVLSSEN